MRGRLRNGQVADVLVQGVRDDFHQLRHLGLAGLRVPNVDGHDVQGRVVSAEEVDGRAVCQRCHARHQRHRDCELVRG
eukprot:7033853-Lingulodinium_polyedra.AAC.1